MTLWKLGLIEHDPAAYTIGSLATKICCQSEVAERISELICEEDAVQDDYAVSAVAADKYAYLGNCDEMDIILSNGVQQGWHFADEDQKYPWDYMNMIYCLEAGKQFSVGTGNSGDADVPLDGTVTNDSTIGERCWFKLSAEQRMAIALVILYGCPTKLWDAEWELNPEGQRIANNPNIGYRFATQALVWEFASGWREAIPPYTLKNSQWRDLSIGVCMNEDKTVDHFLYAYNSILNDLMLHNVISGFVGHFQNSAPEIQLTGNAVTVTDTNGVLSRLTFTDLDTVSYSISGDDLTISVSGAVPVDVQCATATLPDPEASLYELWYNGYTSSYQTAIKVSVPSSDPVPAYFKLKTSTGALSLKKTTEDGKNLEGWKFSIYSDSACKNLISGPHTTNAKGELSVSGLSAGTVYVKEIGHTDSAINALYECTVENPQKVNIVSGQTATVMRIDIIVDSEASSISIRDNGMGIPFSEAKDTLMNVGNSKKRHSNNRGFRGIGRLGGMSYCDTLVFTTSSETEKKKTTVTFDCKKLRSLLIPGQHEDMSLSDVLSEITTVTINEKRADKHYFLVEMQNVSSFSDLLNIDLVKSYVAQVAPVSYQSRYFIYSTELPGYLSNRGYNLEEFHIFIGECESDIEPIYKPNRSRFHSDRNKKTR